MTLAQLKALFDSIIRQKTAANSISTDDVADQLDAVGDFVAQEITNQVSYINDQTLAGDGATTGTALTVKDGGITDAKLATDVKVGSLAALSTTNKSNVVAAINEVKALVGTGGGSGSSDMVLINTLTISSGTPVNSQVISLAASLSTYLNFQIRLIDIVPSADGDLSLQVSSDGTTYKSGATDYDWQYDYGANTTPGTDAPHVLNRMKAGAGFAHSGVVTLWNPNNALKKPAISWLSIVADWGTSTPVTLNGASYCRTVQGTNSIKLIMDGAKTFSGKIELWGLK